jgi:CIC family chloride channel protein
VLLLFEVTNQWVIVPALMLAIIISQVVARWVNHHDMYEETMVQDGLDPNQVLPPRHFKRWREIPVSALASFKPVIATSLERDALRELLARSGHNYFPVADTNGRVTGILARREAELAVASPGHVPLITPPLWVSAKSTVGVARKRMLGEGGDFLCVGDEATGELRGIMTLHDLLRGESVLEDDAGA